MNSIDFTAGSPWEASLDPWPQVRFSSGERAEARIEGPRSGRAMSARRIAYLRELTSGPWGHLVPPAGVEGDGRASVHSVPVLGALSAAALGVAGVGKGAVADVGEPAAVGDPFPGVPEAETIGYGFDLFGPTVVLDGVVIDDPAFVCLRQARMRNCCPKVANSFFMFPDPIGAGSFEWIADAYDAISGQCQ